MRIHVKAIGCISCFLWGALLLSSPAHAQEENWRQLLKDRIQLYGHRNWIVVADSAYPAQSRDGIETIIVNSGQLDVLKEVLTGLASSRHVRPVPYIDRELKYVDDADAPGVDAYRKQISALLPDAETHSIPHDRIIKNLDSAGQEFRVLIIKTNGTIPYTSVFLQLNCAYWSDESEQKLRAAMAR